jgi:hypothetical protein
VGCVVLAVCWAVLAVCRAFARWMEGNVPSLIPGVYLARFARQGSVPCICLLAPSKASSPVQPRQLHLYKCCDPLLHTAGQQVPMSPLMVSRGGVFGHTSGERVGPTPVPTYLLRSVGLRSVPGEPLDLSQARVVEHGASTLSVHLCRHPTALSMLTRLLCSIRVFDVFAIF